MGRRGLILFAVTLGLVVAFGACAWVIWPGVGSVEDSLGCKEDAMKCAEEVPMLRQAMDNAAQDDVFGLLKELTEEGIENGHLGLQGRVTSDVRAEFVEDPGWDQVEAWVLREVKWEVGPVDQERSVKDSFAVVPVVARGVGRLGDEPESLAAVARYMVLYGTAGEFPGLLGVREDGEPLVIYAILESKYDWRIAVPD